MSAARILALIVCCACLAACDDAGGADGGHIGDAGNGARLIMEAGCGACHQVPGIARATGLVGPPLDHMARREFIAGLLRNTPPNMVAWLRDPQRISPGNAMPDTGLSEAEARDIAAYLYTLE